jgi:SAM-dependent methyltransferase
VTRDDDRLRRTFDEDAELYDRRRPGYPAALIGDLVDLGGLEKGAAILEIGCGTGQATRSLAPPGYKITCIELGQHLAAVARARLATYRNVSVVTAAFETWDPAGSSFDMVLAATSWHWLDPKLRYAKAAAILRRRGSLAIITTHHVLPEHGDDFFREVQTAYAAIGQGDPPPPPPDAVPDSREEIEAGGSFTDVRVRRYLWSESYSADDYIALLDTYSGHRAMAPAQRRRLYDEIRFLIRRRPGGRVRKHYLFALHVAPVSHP